MWRIAEYFQLLVIIAIFAHCHGQGKSVKIVNEGANGTAPRLGLLASTLGVDPVPGYSGSSATAPAGGIPSQDYLPTGGAPALEQYTSDGGGIQGGNLVSSNQCQCVPVEYCPSLGGGQGQQQGGVFPIPGGGGSHEGGQQEGNLPVIGGGDGNYAGGQQGGNLPVIGGGGDGSYGAGQGGNIPGTDPGLQPGYGPGDQPNTDGAGLLDLRIVNRPPRPGGVQCLPGQVFCCDGQNPGPNPGPGGTGYTGYANCGSRKYIDVPSKKLEYGEAKFGAYPWMAVILGKGNNYVGAGALISPNFVLTAAHKIKSWKPGATMKVRLGEWNAKEDDEPYKNVEVPIESVLIHPGFNIDNLQNDIALVKLAKPVDTKAYPHIEAACLPQKGYEYTGQRCFVAGFGKDAFGNGKHSYIMKEVDLPIVDQDICEQRMRTTRLGPHFNLNRYSFLCAGGEEGKDACTGDGGSPLVCNTGKWQVVGLVAWGIGCADYGIPGVYVNVPNYADWINEEIYKY
ncbi:Serine protease 44 [Orchesella cincta]|uniref:Phenoloxidase-activating factor 2 n=1 Tax=Orchesella cincta TaxID=48709 RepID=A0A1D2N5H0_ORCCI|nr:Serine protease 44 [Orchesella cincta]